MTRRTKVAAGIALAIIGCASTAWATEQTQSYDWNWANHRLRGLATPASSTDAARVQDVAPGACIPKSPGANTLPFICSVAETDYITPAYPFGGQLGGTPASATVLGLRETGGPTLLTIGAIVDGALTKRSGSTFVGATAGVDYENPLTFLAPLSRTGDVVSLPMSAASRLLGRGSASGAGAAEEISLGSGLSMSGMTLSAIGLGGTVTNVTATLPLTSSGGTTPDIAVQYDNVSLTLSGTNALQRGALGGDLSCAAGSNSCTVPAIAAHFLADRSEASLANEVNLGSLTNGTLQQTVSGGVASLSAFNGTAGSLPFYVANGQLSQDNSNLFWDSSAHRLDLNGTTALAIGPHVTGQAMGFRVRDTNATLSQLYLYPNGGTNVSPTVLITPRGTGASSTVKADLTLYNTDFFADSVNTESISIRTVGANGTVIGTGKSGTGSNRPIMLASGWMTNGTTNADQLLLNTDGTVKMVSLAGTGTRFVTATSAGVLGTDSTAYVPATRTLTAGAGMTGGGDLSADRTFDVVAGDATVVVHANDVVAGVMQTANLANNSVTNAILRDSGALSLIGRNVNTTGDPADISATAGSDCVFREGGSTIACSQVATNGIANSAITYAKIQNVGASKLLGNPAASPAAPTEISVGTGLNLSVGGALTATGVASVSGTAGRVSSTGGTTPVIDLVTTGAGAGSCTYCTVQFDAYGREVTYSSGTTPEVPLTFSTGLTRSSNTVTANLSTGVAGGQTMYGGTATGNNLTIHSNTSNDGRVIVGATTLASFDEAATTRAAFQVGTSSTTPVGTVAHFSRNVNGYASLNIVNPNTGIGASSGITLLQSDTSFAGTALFVNLQSSGFGAIGPIVANSGLFELQGSAPIIYSIYGSSGDHIFTTTTSRNERLRIASNGVIKMPSTDSGSITLALTKSGDQYIEKQGSGNMYIGTAGAQLIGLYTGGTTRVSIASGGGVTMTSLAGTGTRIVSASATGLLGIASAADVGTTLGIAANEVLFSGGPTSAPTANASFTYDTGADYVTLAGADLAFYNLGSSDASTNFERLRLRHTGSVYEFISEKAGTGTVRDIKVNANTAALHLNGTNVYVDNLTTNGYVTTGGGNGHLGVTAPPVSMAMKYSIYALGFSGNGLTENYKTIYTPSDTGLTAMTTTNGTISAGGGSVAANLAAAQNTSASPAYMTAATDWPSCKMRVEIPYFVGTGSGSATLKVGLWRASPMSTSGSYVERAVTTFTIGTGTSSASDVATCSAGVAAGEQFFVAIYRSDSNASYTLTPVDIRVNVEFWK